jgi:hypothetical protein
MTPDQIIEVLQGVKVGRKWQYFMTTNSKFVTPDYQSTGHFLYRAHCEFAIQLCLAPDKITLPARTIPAPLRQAPKVGDTYYLPNACNEAWFDSQQWDGDSYDFIALKNGQCYSAAERAILAAKAQVPYES